MEKTLQHSKFTKPMKELFLQQIVSESLDRITERCVNWFEDVFIKGKDEESKTDLLKTDLQYLISRPEWIVSLGKKLNLDMTDSERHVDTFAKVINDSDTSFRRLVMDVRYDNENHRLRTPEEIKKHKEDTNRWVDDLMNSFTDTKNK